jgi:predicted secreted protein
MGVFEVIVVFVIFWWLVFLPLLSAGTRSQHEAGEVVAGTEPGAPTAHGLGRKVVWATAAAAVLTALVAAAVLSGLLEAVFQLGVDR